MRYERVLRISFVPPCMESALDRQSRVILDNSRLLTVSWKYFPVIFWITSQSRNKDEKRSRRYLVGTNPFVRTYFGGHMNRHQISPRSNLYQSKAVSSERW